MPFTSSINLFICILFYHDTFHLVVHFTSINALSSDFDYGEAFQMLTFIFDRQRLVAIRGGGMLLSRNTYCGRIYRYLFTINLSLHEMLMQI